MDAITELRDYCWEIGCPCLENEPMSRHTSFKVGGPVRLFVQPTDAKVAAAVLQKIYARSIPLNILGNGSDVLIPDAGLEAVVISMADKLEAMTVENEMKIICPAGISLAKLCTFACDMGLSGLEFAWGIPASVGGAICMNAGAYGGDIKDVLFSVEYLDACGRSHTSSVSELAMRYRHTWFTENPKNLIVKACFCLTKDNPISIRARMDMHMAARREKQPLEYPSAGSTFKRPVGAYAAQLIDQCGLKGRRIGGAMVSEKHAGFIINYDNASSEDIKLLIEEVRHKVKEQTGIILECEVKFL